MQRLTLCLIVLLALLAACAPAPDAADTGTTASTDEATPVMAEEATPVVAEEPVASSSPTASPLPTEEPTPAAEAATMTPAPLPTVKATAEPQPTTEVPMDEPMAPEVIFIYEREGGFAGFCDTVTVYATEADWVNCNGRAMKFSLDPATTDELRNLATTYSAFQTDSEDNPGGSDSMRLGIRFNGTGSTSVTGDVEATLHRIGQEILQKAYQAMQ